MSLMDIMTGSKRDSDGSLLDAKGTNIDLHKIVITEDIQPRTYRASDLRTEEGLAQDI